MRPILRFSSCWRSVPTSRLNRTQLSLKLSRRLATQTHTKSSNGGYTTAFAMLEALWEAGVKSCFVNVGSDHPSLIEAIVKGKKERPDRFPKFYTCPSEITAISLADGHSRLTSHPSAVLTHVDVGTQALSFGLHNASVGRTPIFIFAGLAPYTESGELTGSRTEYMHWLQDPLDQKGVVRGYCRWVGEVRSGRNVKRMVWRGIQVSGSSPRGPVYLGGAREVLAEELPRVGEGEEMGEEKGEGEWGEQWRPGEWEPVGSGALPHSAVSKLANALVHATSPLIITGYSGRNRHCPSLLAHLATLIPGLRVHDTGGSDVCFPASHRGSLGFRLAVDDCTKDADVILVLDCDVPWIPSRNPPRRDARVYWVDLDPLKMGMGVQFFRAGGRWRADAGVAVGQVIGYIEGEEGLRRTLEGPEYGERWERLGEGHAKRIAAADALVRAGPGETLDAHNVGATLRDCLPGDTVFVVEAVTCSHALADQLRPDIPGTWLNCGGTGIGWSNGAALGARLGLDELGDDLGVGVVGKAEQAEQAGVEEAEESGKAEESPGKRKRKLVVQVVGDGSYMCGSPASAAWVGEKYGIHILTVVLNNGGWNAPRNSTELVYPDGMAAAGTNEDLNIAFHPSPDYAGLAKSAAGGAESRLFAKRVANVQELREGLIEAARKVGEGRGAILDVKLERRP